MKDLYRKAPMENLSVPEQLNQRVQLTSTSVWIVILSGVLILLAVIVWGVYGSIPVCEEMEGIYKKESKELICYVPWDGKTKIQKGMEVYFLTGEGLHAERVSGSVSETATFPSTEEEMIQELEAQSLVSYFQTKGPVIRIKCHTHEEKGKSGIVQVRVITERESPLEIFLGKGAT